MQGASGNPTFGRKSRTERRRCGRGGDSKSRQAALPRSGLQIPACCGAGRAEPGRAGSAALLWHGSSGGRGRQWNRAGPGRAEQSRAEPGRAAPRCRPAGFRVPSARSRGVSCGAGEREGGDGGRAVLPGTGANLCWFVSSRFAYICIYICIYIERECLFFMLIFHLPPLLPPSFFLLLFK